MIKIQWENIGHADLLLPSIVNYHNQYSINNDHFNLGKIYWSHSFWPEKQSRTQYTLGEMLYITNNYINALWNISWIHLLLTEHPNKRWWSGRDMGASIHCWQEHKLAQPSWSTDLAKYITIKYVHKPFTEEFLFLVSEL